MNDASHLLSLLAILMAVASAWMMCTYLLARWLKNAGIVDVTWAFGFVLLTLVGVALTNGWIERKTLVASMMMLWSIRLGIHLTRRFLRWLPKEDPRYTAIREAAGSKAESTIFWVFQWQGLIMALLMAPAVVAFANRSSGFSVSEYGGALVWLVGLIGESVADAQLSHFTTAPANKGKTCDTGLWRYSRHPNYFFEWLIWVGLFIFSCSSPFGYATVIAPIVMLHLLINVTGVKPAEEHSLKARGEEYRRYMSQTSVFVPWFSRQAQHNEHDEH